MEWAHPVRLDWTSTAAAGRLIVMQSIALFVALAALVAPVSFVFGQQRAASSGADESPQWVTYTGTKGPGVGKHIVLVSGDEEYRSEEALPQLGKILALRHGFTCTVLFAIDPATGEIDPNNQQNIPGLEALDDADLMIIATRFRDLPDEQMKHIDDYLKSGKPLIGMRTATHAFAVKSSETYKHLSNNAPGGGFGRVYLGEKWIAHHGKHGQQSTRGILSPKGVGHPIARGIERYSIWGPTDVYKVRLPMPPRCETIVFGMVLDGMEQRSDGIAGPVNQPMMPVAWVQERGDMPDDDGTVLPSRTFTTTMGAATDLVADGTRRMIVNAVYWVMGMEDQIPRSGSDVRLVGVYEPTPFGFGGFVKGKTPADHALTKDQLKDK
jgi:type 1 glutamine amidotransferase